MVLAVERRSLRRREVRRHSVRTHRQILNALLLDRVEELGQPRGRVLHLEVPVAHRRTAVDLLQLARQGLPVDAVLRQSEPLNRSQINSMLLTQLQQADLVHAHGFQRSLGGFTRHHRRRHAARTT